MFTALVIASCPAMFTSHSLRHRVALGFALLSLLVVAAHSLALYFIVEDREEEQIDRVVNEEMEAFITRYRANPATALPRSQNLTAYVVREAANGPSLARSPRLGPIGDPAGRAALPEYLRALTIGMHEVRVNGGERHISVRALGETRFYLIYDVTHHELQMRELVWLLGFGLVTTAVLAMVIGGLLARYLTQPVADLAARVAELGPDQLSPAPLAPAYRDQEVRKLAESFDAYTARMTDFVKRETEFTADISHELRTPLTAIRTGCELLLADQHLHDDQRRRLERIERSAERMTAVIQSILLLARHQPEGENEPVLLRDCVAGVAELLRERLVSPGIEWRNEIPAGASRCLDRSALEVVISNLLRNAVDSTDSGHIAVRYQDATLEIEDTGRGISVSDLPHVFERHFRGEGAPPGGGYGIGLALVKRVADRYGWTLRLDSQPGQGTRVRLSFPAADSA